MYIIYYYYGTSSKLQARTRQTASIFINESTQARTKVDASDIVTNNPSELIIVIPALTAGMYKVEVTTQYSSSNGTLKEPRTAIFDRLLTVQ